MIKDLCVGATVNNEIMYCTAKSINVSVKGDQYLSLTLQDASGIISAKVWDINNNIEDFTKNNFLRVNGVVTSFKDNLQINISSISVINPLDVNLDEFCPKSPNDIDHMFTELLEIIDTVQNEYLKQLLYCFFHNEKFVNGFKSNSAAKTVHHAYIGGLLEHTLSVTKLCLTLADTYPKINKDLLVTAAICHDIGKLKEISEFPNNDYTDIGMLLGHIYLGAEMIDVQARKIDKFPPVLLAELKHCILAHHGELEYGSPKTPAIIEAAALHLADETDAKLRRFSDILDNLNDSTWSDKNDLFLNSKYRKTTD